MKRLVFCFDGTWNRIDGHDPTNVVRPQDRAPKVSRTTREESDECERCSARRTAHV